MWLTCHGKKVQNPPRGTPPILQKAPVCQWAILALTVEHVSTCTAHSVSHNPQSKDTTGG
jgi:hypothetical protein